MSIAAFAGGEAALAEQEPAVAGKDKTPRKRVTLAKADVVSQPEAR